MKKTKDILIRNLPIDVANKLTELAQLNGENRMQFIIKRLTELANSDGGWQSENLSYGEGLIAYTPDGGEISLRQLVEDVQSTVIGLNSEEARLLKKLKLLVSPKNGGQWVKARQLMEEAGFEVFNV
jgi:hypothetical protein